MIGKKGEFNIFWVIVIGVVLLLYFQPGIFNMQKADTTTVEDETPQPQTAEDVVYCGDSSIVMTVGPVKKKWSPSTSMASEQHRVFKNSIDQGLKTDSTTMNVAWKDSIDIYYSANSTSYYSSKPSTIIAPCATFSTADRDGDTNQVYANSSISTWNIFNSNGNLNAQTDNESIGSGESKTFKMVMRGDSEKGVSPNGKVIVVVEQNVTAFDQGITNIDGFASASDPSGILYKLASTANAIKTFSTEGGPSGDVRQWSVETFITIKAASGKNPTSAGSTAETVFLTAFGEDYCVSTDITNKMLLAVEDEDGNVRTNALDDTCGASHLRTLKKLWYD